MKIIICFPAPIILALLLNEVRAKKYKSVIQTMSYLPNFVSWAVVQDVGVQNLGKLHVGGLLQQQELIHIRAQDAAHPHDEHDADGGGDTRDGHMPGALPAAGGQTILTAIFSPYGGVFNDIRKAMGLEPIFVLGEKGAFYPLVILTDIWKNVGWGSIVYLSAITGVDQGLYEAATIDGASRWQCTWHVTIPGIATTIGIMFIMGAILSSLNALA